MTSWFGYSFGLLNPAWLIALPIGLGILVLAYLRRNRLKASIISSVIILKQLRTKPISRKKFSPPWRFFFELLLMCLLSLGLAGLFRRDTGTSIALILDNSFSMLAREDGPSGVTTLFAQAKDQALGFLRTLPSSAQVDLYSSAPGMISLTLGLVSPNRAISLLEKMESAFAADDLESGLRRLAAQNKYDQIVILTDQQAKAPLNESNIRSTWKLYTFGAENGQTNPGNISISGIRIAQTPESAVLVEIANYNSTKTRMVASLYGYRSDSVGIESKIQTKNLEIGPGEKETIVFAELPAQFIGFKAGLELANQTDSLKSNAILEDDRAFITIETKLQRIGLISPLPTSQLGLDSIKNFEFVPLNLADLLKPELTDQLLGVIFHRIVPEELPKLNSIFIFPERATSAVEISGTHNSVQPTRWDKSHSIMNYLNLPIVKLPVAKTLPPPIWAETLVYSSFGSIVWAGEWKNHRYLAIGLEIFPYEGRKAPLLSILTLNALKWISQSNFSTDYDSTFIPLKTGLPVTSARYIDRSEDLPYQVNAADLVVQKTGLLQVKHQANASSIRAINFFNDAESNLQLKPEITLPVTSASPEIKSNTKTYIWEISLILLLLLCFDAMFLYVRRIRG